MSRENTSEFLFLLHFLNVLQKSLIWICFHRREKQLAGCFESRIFIKMLLDNIIHIL